MITYDMIKQAADVARSKIGEADTAVILGSGLGDYASTCENTKSVKYTDLPGFPASTVTGHAGEFVSGDKGGHRIIIMNGRFHMYEGFPLDQIALPIRVLRLLGVRNLIITNAAGGVNLNYHPGDLMIITDYINLTGRSPLTGPNLDEFGPRFPDMTRVFDRELRMICLEQALEMKVNIREGVYCCMPGPCYETPAEIRMIRLLGGDAVGMSTVPDVMTAAHAGMRVLGISCITNLAAGILDQPLSHEEVLEAGRKIGKTFLGLIDGVISRMNSPR